MGYWKTFFDYWNMTQQAFLNMIRRVPESALDFKPTPEFYTLRKLLLHIIRCEWEMAEGARRGELNDEVLEAYEEPEINSVKDIYNAAFETHEATRRVFENMTDEELMKPVKIAWLPEPQPVISVLIHAFEELVHHRGQATLFFRLLKLEPVDIYDYSKEPEEVSAS